MNLPSITNGAPHYTVFQLVAAALANHNDCHIRVIIDDRRETRCDIINGKIFVPDNAFNSDILNAPIQSGMYVKVEGEKPTYNIIAHII